MKLSAICFTLALIFYLKLNSVEVAPEGLMADSEHSRQQVSSLFSMYFFGSFILGIVFWLKEQFENVDKD